MESPEVFFEMSFVASNIDETFLPPPQGVLRRGTPEFFNALQNGDIKLSLPPSEVESWLQFKSCTPSGSKTTSCTKRQKLNCSRSDNGCCEETCSCRSGGGKVESDDRGINECQSDDEIDTGEIHPCSNNHKAMKSSCKGLTKHRIELPYARFHDIIGHGSVKLRLDELLLPLALPSGVADSILTGASHRQLNWSRYLLNLRLRFYYAQTQAFGHTLRRF